jgi:hypothetical protein
MESNNRVNKTPAYTLRAQKAYYQRIKNDPLKNEARKEYNKQYYEIRKLKLLLDKYSEEFEEKLKDKIKKKYEKQREKVLNLLQDKSVKTETDEDLISQFEISEISDFDD